MRSGIIGGSILIILGLIFLLRNLGLIPWGIGELWPVLIILLGIWILAKPWRKGDK